MQFLLYFRIVCSIYLLLHCFYCYSFYWYFLNSSNHLSSIDSSWDLSYEPSYLLVKLKLYTVHSKNELIHYSIEINFVSYQLLVFNRRMLFLSKCSFVFLLSLFLYFSFTISTLNTQFHCSLEMNLIIYSTMQAREVLKKSFVILCHLIFLDFLFSGYNYDFCYYFGWNYSLI